jgi:hypothetical protein
LFSRKHIDDSGAADARFHHDKTRMIAGDFANDGSLLIARLISPLTPFFSLLCGEQKRQNRAA